MARISTYDANRFRKNYPYLRRIPGLQSLGENMNFEVAIINFSATDEMVYAFTKNFSSTPVAVLTPFDENINVYIGSINQYQITINASAPFTGAVHLIATEAS